MPTSADDIPEALLNAIVGKVFLNHVVKPRSSAFAGASARGSAWTEIPWNEAIGYERTFGKPAPAPHGYDQQRPKAGPQGGPGNENYAGVSDPDPIFIGRSQYAPDPPIPPQPAKTAKPFAGRRATGSAEF